MNWITRCPACATFYRVTPDQLQASRGWLRCGQCQQSFDSTGLVVSSAFSMPHPAPMTGGSTDRVPLDDLLLREDVRAAPQEPEANVVSSFEEALSSFKPLPESSAVRGAAQTNDAVPVHKRSAWAVWVWGWVLFLVCLLQGLWVSRHYLAAHYPESRPVLGAFCRFLACEVLPLPVRGAVVIDTSSLSPQGDGLVLRWTLRNTQAIGVQMPAVELTLTDAQDQAVLRRVFTSNQVQAPKALTAGQTWEGALHVWPLDELVTTGYRLQLFYP